MSSHRFLADQLALFDALLGELISHLHPSGLAFLAQATVAPSAPVGHDAERSRPTSDTVELSPAPDALDNGSDRLVGARADQPASKQLQTVAQPAHIGLPNLRKPGMPDRRGDRRDELVVSNEWRPKKISLSPGESERRYGDPPDRATHEPENELANDPQIERDHEQHSPVPGKSVIRRLIAPRHIGRPLPLQSQPMSDGARLAATRQTEPPEPPEMPAESARQAHTDDPGMLVADSRGDTRHRDRHESREQSQNSGSTNKPAMPNKPAIATEPASRAPAGRHRDPLTPIPVTTSTREILGSVAGSPQRPPSAPEASARLRLRIAPPRQFDPPASGQRLVARPTTPIRGPQNDRFSQVGLRARSARLPAQTDRLTRPGAISPQISPAAPPLPGSASPLEARLPAVEPLAQPTCGIDLQLERRLIAILIDEARREGLEL